MFPPERIVCLTGETIETLRLRVRQEVRAGPQFVPARVAMRAGFADVAAVRTGWLHDIKSPLILQPGRAALTGSLDALVAIADWSERAM